MKIYSWNVLRSNRKLPELYAFIENLDFDVLCLQEVTEEMLTVFKDMPFEIAYHVDRFSHVVTFRKKAYVEVNYAVILSRHPIVSHTKIEFPKLLRTFSSKVFESIMGRLERWESITNMGSVLADIKINGNVVRVFSVHLALWNPQTRVNEFIELMKYAPKEHPTIICGDFNILEYAPVKLLNWFLGGSIREAMPWYSERALIEEKFREYSFENPFLGKTTHKFSHSQLDHILVSPHLNAKNPKVLSNAYGSDHQPIGLEIEFR